MLKAIFFLIKNSNPRSPDHSHTHTHKKLYSVCTAACFHVKHEKDLLFEADSLSNLVKDFFCKLFLIVYLFLLDSTPHMFYCYNRSFGLTRCFLASISLSLPNTNTYYQNTGLVLPFMLLYLAYSHFSRQTALQ